MPNLPFLQVFLLVFLLLAPWLNAGEAHAEVLDSSVGGFTSQHVLSIAAPPTLVFRALTEEIGRWWNADHSYSGDAANFTLEPRAGRCFCETLANGGTVEHLRVLFVDPGKTLRLGGGLGPLQAMGVTGAMTFSLTASESGTDLTYRYVVGGYSADGLDSLAEPVDRVQLGQLQRLKRFVETGQPDAP